MPALNYKTVSHRFGPSETIRAVVRKLNHQGMSSTMLDLMLEEFNKLNNNRVPKPGEVFEIPIFSGFLGAGDDDSMGR